MIFETCTLKNLAYTFGMNLPTKLVTFILVATFVTSVMSPSVQKSSLRARETIQGTHMKLVSKDVDTTESVPLGNIQIDSVPIANNQSESVATGDDQAKLLATGNNQPESLSTDASHSKTNISYGALRRNSVPCSHRGASKANCQPGTPANPYTRGCGPIAKCRGQ